MSIHGNNSRSLVKMNIYSVPFLEVHNYQIVPSTNQQWRGLDAGGVEGLQCRWGRIFWQFPWGQKCLTKEVMGTSGHLAQADTLSQTARWSAWGQLPKIRLHWKRSRSDWWIWVVLMSRQIWVSKRLPEINGQHKAWYLHLLIPSFTASFTVTGFTIIVLKLLLPGSLEMVHKAHRAEENYFGTCTAKII